MSIGEKIYELRTAKNLSQGEVADLLGVSRQSVSKWETDGAVPELDKLMKLCDLFGVSMDELTCRRAQTAENQNSLAQSACIAEPVPEIACIAEPIPEGACTTEPIPESVRAAEPVLESIRAAEPIPESAHTAEPIPESARTAKSAPKKRRFGAKNITGIVFLSAGLLSVILGLLPFGFGGLLIFGIYFTGVGTLCLTVKRRLWLPILIYSVVFFVVLSFWIFLQTPASFVETVEFE